MSQKRLLVEPDELDDRLQTLTADFLFETDAPARRRDGEVEVSVTPDVVDGREQCLIGVTCGGRFRSGFRGFTWEVRSAATGAVVSRGEQLGRPTVRITAPEPGGYALHVGHPATLDRHAFEAVREQYERAEGAPDLQQWAVGKMSDLATSDALHFLYTVRATNTDPGVRTAAAAAIAAVLPVHPRRDAFTRAEVRLEPAQAAAGEDMVWSLPFTHRPNETGLRPDDIRYWWGYNPSTRRQVLRFEAVMELPTDLLAVSEPRAEPSRPAFFVALTADDSGVLVGEVDLTALGASGALTRLPTPDDSPEFFVEPFRHDALRLEHRPALEAGRGATDREQPDAVLKLQALIDHLATSGSATGGSQ